MNGRGRFLPRADESVTADEGFDIWDARLFLDAELGDTSLIRNIGVYF